MKSRIQIFITLLIVIIFFTNCNSQETKSNLITRKPAVDGRFYPKSPDELKLKVEELFEKAKTKQVDNDVVAVIVPHAGYVFSGAVAASSFNQIDPDKKFGNIFLIGSSHKTSFNSASVYNAGNYKTPFGEVKVNIELANKLIEENEVFNFYRDAHIFEHSLEVQLPLMQQYFTHEFKIVPIIIGAQNTDVPMEIAEALLPFFNEENLFVISSDFSHYPNYEDANLVDNITTQAILTGKPEIFINTLSQIEDNKIEGLVTACCGWTSVLALLNMVSAKDNIYLEHIEYRNSGDTKNGDKSGVVGYNSIVACSGVKSEEVNQVEFVLEKDDKTALLEIAKRTVDEHVNKKKITKLNSEDYNIVLATHCGAFVTLNKNGQLRGCIGRFSANQPLVNVIQEMAISASTEDHRFNPVSSEEIKDLEIEISVLTPMRKIESIDEIILGKHGIYIKKGMRGGTFLPQVATETGWTLEEFLGHCARDKAGIGWDGWKDADIYIYEATVFSEEDFSE